MLTIFKFIVHHQFYDNDIVVVLLNLIRSMKLLSQISPLHYILVLYLPATSQSLMISTS